MDIVLDSAQPTCSVRDRILQFLKEEGLGQTKFEEKCGISRGYLSKIKGEVGSSALNKIGAAFPKLNISWVVTGLGDMLSPSAEHKEEMSRLADEIDKEYMSKAEENAAFLKSASCRLDIAYQYLRDSGIVHTRNDVASALKTSASSISRAFKGVPNYCTRQFLLRFNKAYGYVFSEEWLLSGIGEMLSFKQEDKTPTDRERLKEIIEAANSGIKIRTGNNTIHGENNTGTQTINAESSREAALVKENEMLKEQIRRLDEEIKFLRGVITAKS